MKPKSSIENTRKLLDAADETWLKSLAPQEKLAGMAYVKCKNALGNKMNSSTRPEVFIYGFELGMAVGLEASKEKKEASENLPGEHL